MSKLLKIELIANKKCEKWDSSYLINKWIFENDDDAAVWLESDLDEVLEDYKAKILSENWDYTSQKLNQIETDLNIDWLNWIYDFMQGRI